jgi:hypothetical protein
MQALRELTDDGVIRCNDGYFIPPTNDLTTMTNEDQPMTEQHRIIPSPELLNQWKREWVCYTHNPASHGEGTYIAIKAARWGADQELEACCDWLAKNTRDAMAIEFLRDARRPQPPTQKELALRLLEANGASTVILTPVQCNIIRRALSTIPTDTQ